MPCPRGPRGRRAGLRSEGRREGAWWPGTRRNSGAQTGGAIAGARAQIPRKDTAATDTQTHGACWRTEKVWRRWRTGHPWRYGLRYRYVGTGTESRVRTRGVRNTDGVAAHGPYTPPMQPDA